MSNFEIQTKWFAEATPQNAKEATANIGSGTDGTVTTTVDVVGTEGNSYTIEVVAGSGNNVAMSAELTDNAIVVTLGTDGVGALDATKNTATLIATAINALSGVSSVASGTGATAIGAAEAVKNFTGGQYATEATIPFTMLKDETYYYVNITPNSRVDKNWRRFTLATY